MIATNIHDYSEMPCFPEHLKKLINCALDIVRETPADGRHTIHGDDAFLLISSPETEPEEQRQAEYHCRYLDVQILLEGREKLGYGLQLAAGEAGGDFIEKQDVAFCKTISNEQFLTFHPGDLAVFFPREYHRPQCATEGKGERIKKAVLKVKMDFLR
ncbi:YhcH/YjgK/YiaL family protein [Erwinia sp. P7711]|uniref:YhcH/YjgK/YiaL family protein n=1 Tax=Erwinia sp. P7711 TaxID=3141451 RepID=UPI003198CDBD